MKTTIPDKYLLTALSPFRFTILANFKIALYRIITLLGVCLVSLVLYFVFLLFLTIPLWVCVTLVLIFILLTLVIHLLSLSLPHMLQDYIHGVIDKRFRSIYKEMEISSHIMSQEMKNLKAKKKYSSELTTDKLLEIAQWHNHMIRFYEHQILSQINKPKKVGHKQIDDQSRLYVLYLNEHIKYSQQLTEDILLLTKYFSDQGDIPKEYLIKARSELIDIYKMILKHLDELERSEHK